MKRTIDKNRPASKGLIPWRTMFGIAVLCFITSLTASAQTMGYQQQADAYQTMLAAIDQSTPAGQAEYAEKLAKFNGLLISSYSTMSEQEQRAFTEWLSSNQNPVFNSNTADNEKAIKQMEIDASVDAQESVAANTLAPAPVVTQPQVSHFVITMPASLPTAPAEVKNHHHGSK